MSEEAPPAEPPPAEGEEAAPAAKDFNPPCVDLTEHVIKTDFFDGAHMLPEEVEKVEGAANFRQISGFPVFGLAQPSPEGMKAVLDKVKASGDDKSNKEPSQYCQVDTSLLSSSGLTLSSLFKNVNCFKTVSKMCLCLAQSV